MVEDIKRILVKLQQMTVEELACYDVKLEDDALQNYINTHAFLFNRPSRAMDEMDPWQKMCYYKISGTTWGTDCDVALFNVVIYYLVYGLEGWTINKYGGGYQLKKTKVEWNLRGDTMNSYATTIHHYIQNQWIQDHEKEMVDDSIIIGKIPISALESSSNKWDDVVLRHYGYFRNVLPASGQEYLRLNHTIGNFIPVPFKENGGQFNFPRGNYKIFADYWDLTLMCICNYYHDVEDQKYNLNRLLGNQNNVNLCTEWLKSYGEGVSGWDTFVEQNFLQQFVGDKKDGHYGMPKELWTGHFAGTVKPKEKEHYNEFFTKASSRITTRGETIAKKIKEVLKNEDLTTLAEKMVYGNGNQ